MYQNMPGTAEQIVLHAERCANRNTAKSELDSPITLAPGQTQILQQVVHEHLHNTLHSVY